MAIEKKWLAVPPQLFTANGGAQGQITVADVTGFKVKQFVVVKSNTQPNLRVQVKRVVKKTGKITVGPPPDQQTQGKAGLKTTTDLTLYTVADGSYLFAEEQDKSTLKPDDIIQAVYRQEPGTTIGVEIDDQFGDPIDSVVGMDGKNRLAVDAQVSVTVATVDVNLDAITPPTRPDPDNVLIVGSEDGTKTGIKHAIRVTDNGTLQTIQIFTKTFDAITATYPTTTQEVYQSRVGGIVGAVQETVTINYTDATKNFVLNVARS